MDINKIVSKALEDKGWLKLSPNDIKIMANRIVELELDIQACKKQCNIPDVVGQSEQLKCDNCKCTPPIIHNTPSGAFCEACRPVTL